MHHAILKWHDALQTLLSGAVKVRQDINSNARLIRFFVNFFILSNGKIG